MHLDYELARFSQSGAKVHSCELKDSAYFLCGVRWICFIHLKRREEKSTGTEGMQQKELEVSLGHWLLKVSSPQIGNANAYQPNQHSTFKLTNLQVQSFANLCLSVPSLDFFVWQASDWPVWPNGKVYIDNCCFGVRLTACVCIFISLVWMGIFFKPEEEKKGHLWNYLCACGLGLRWQPFVCLRPCLYSKWFNNNTEFTGIGINNNSTYIWRNKNRLRLLCANKSVFKFPCMKIGTQIYSTASTFQVEIK